MAVDEAHEILQRAQEENSDPAVVLSEVLVVLFRQRLLPLDPYYVSVSACCSILSARPDIHLLLGTAIEEQNWDILLTSGKSLYLLTLKDADMRSQKPQCQVDFAVEDKINTFLDTYATLLTVYARSDSGPPLWVPDDEVPDVPASYTRFITSLRIPDIGDDDPCLLLHGLGNMLEGQSLSARLQNIFRPGHHTLYINSTASGKTRSVLEGLSRNWGVYFPYIGHSASLGSSELPVQFDMNLNRFKKPAPGVQPDVWQTQGVAANVQVARRLAALVLFARLIIFKTYLEALPDAHDPKHRKRWLLLQVSSSTMVGRQPFQELPFRLREAIDCSPGYIEHRLADTLLRIRALLGRDEPIYCVLEDAQGASNYHADRFRPSSALREITRCWEGLEGLTLVICGTPFDVTPFRQPGVQYRLCTDTGSFDNRDDQAAYVRRYLPPELATSDTGRKLVDRICLWLRGRYRLTSSFVNCLLATRYSEPHTLLSAFIAANAGVEPGDGPMRMDSLEDYAKLHILDDDALLIAQAVVQRVMTLGQESVKITEDCMHMVSLVFARFTNADGTEAVIDEPFFVFPVVRLLFREWGPLSGFLHMRHATSLDAMPSRLPFHLAVVPLLLLASRRKQPLSHLLEFDDPQHPWANQTYNLVRLSSSEGQLRAQPYISPFPEEDDLEPWATESPDWLQHTRPEPFCVASGFSHADLIFAVQLASGELLYVALKIMLKNDAIDVSAENIEQSLARMTPDHIFEVCVPNAPPSTRPRFSEVPNVGSLPVLRAFATFPKATKVKVLARNPLPSPTAVLNLPALQALSAGIPYPPILRRVAAALIPPRQRRMVGDASLCIEVEDD
ncbi:hypothetical protein BD626DRAFT_396802 [Schizophyllum amplum]|uniref:Uncharacterized protein n=1 Tax=Schizophyllum amplum TaxID=97359 RepID=A0A550CP88_9AGAR|nr:hypothetical protein BD626DRAFT_396802 [Auriculariopsis ampla]